jgi:hypothetical protein
MEVVSNDGHPIWKKEQLKQVFLFFFEGAVWVCLVCEIFLALATVALSFVFIN